MLKWARLCGFNPGNQERVEMEKKRLVLKVKDWGWFTHVITRIFSISGSQTFFFDHCLSECEQCRERYTNRCEKALDNGSDQHASSLPTIAEHHLWTADIITQHDMAARSNIPISKMFDRSRNLPNDNTTSDCNTH